MDTRDSLSTVRSEILLILVFILLTCIRQIINMAIDIPHRRKKRPVGDFLALQVLNPHDSLLVRRTFKDLSWPNGANIFHGQPSRQLLLLGI
jgi:hypothetical protein